MAAEKTGVHGMARLIERVRIGEQCSQAIASERRERLMVGREALSQRLAPRMGPLAKVVSRG